MRRITGFSLGAVLLVAACGSAASTPAPTSTAVLPPTSGPTESAPAPSPSASTAAQAKVTFDGDVCKYFGPLVVPSNTKLTIDFQMGSAASAETAMVVAPVWDGTTAEDIAKIDTDWPPSKGQPPFMLPMASYMASKVGAGSITVELDAMTNSHAYVVGCLDYKLDKARAAGLIQVLSA